MRYSIKVLPGVRVYGGSSRRRSTSSPGCVPILIGLVLLIGLLFWPLMVFTHRWVTRQRVDCSVAACNGFQYAGHQWQSVGHSGPTVSGVVIEVVWAIFVLFVVLATLGARSVAKSQGAAMTPTPDAPASDFTVLQRRYDEAMAAQDYEAAIELARQQEEAAAAAKRRAESSGGGLLPQ
jgi:hypothetical protein